jgi:hypothetical protein
MRSSFLDDRNFPLVFMGILLGMPLTAVLLTACTKPTPEEQAQANMTYGDKILEEIIIVSPRPGVECYVLRGHGEAAPRTLSCVVLPVTTGQ